MAWSALYATVGALIVWYRVVTPLLSSARHQFTVQYVRPEAPGIVSVFITGRNLDRLRAEPGQFFRWRFLTRELWWQSHPYSLSAMPSPNQMRITVKANGDHSGSLAGLAPGTRIFAEGPYGAFTPSLTGRRVLFIAGGVGITPIRAMFAALPRRMSGGIILLYRASHPRDVVFSRELNAIATDRQAALRYLIGSRDELGYDPLETENLQRAIPGLHRYEAYVCGPARHDPDSGDRAARGGHTVAPHPPRVLRLLTPTLPDPTHPDPTGHPGRSHAPRHLDPRQHRRRARRAAFVQDPLVGGGRGRARRLPGRRVRRRHARRVRHRAGEDRRRRPARPPRP